MADAKATVSYIPEPFYHYSVGFLLASLFFGLVVNRDTTLQSLGMSGYLSSSTALFKRNTRHSLIEIKSCTVFC